MGAQEASPQSSFRDRSPLWLGGSPDQRAALHLVSNVADAIRDRFFTVDKPDWETNFTSLMEQVHHYFAARDFHKIMHAHPQLEQLLFKKKTFGIDVFMFTELWEEGIDELGKKLNANLKSLKTSHANSSPGDAPHDARITMIIRIRTKQLLRPKAPSLIQVDLE